MRLIRSLNSKRVGAVLAVLFIVGLVFMTIYSRSYAERRKPLVTVSTFESGKLHWSYDIKSSIEPADEMFVGEGIEWTIEVHIPVAAFEEYMNYPHFLVATAQTVSLGVQEPIELLRVENFDDGSVTRTYSYTSKLWEQYDRHLWPGENVTVRLVPVDVTYDSLIPYSAVNFDEDAGEFYLFTVSRRETAWGREYYAQRRTVEFNSPARIGNMAHLRLDKLSLTDLIIITSDAPLYDGAPVRVYD